MNLYIAALFRIEILFGVGIGLVLIGVIFANITRRQSDLFSFRREDTDQTRKSGEIERTDLLDAKNVLILNRRLILGRVLIAAGVTAILAGAFLSA